MIWIGLTGGIASGKSTVSKWLKQKGYPVADADAIVHELLSSDPQCISEIKKQFGEAVIDPQTKSVDRKSLGKRVFGSSDQLALLESILHPKVQKKVSELRSQWQKEGRSLAFYDVPLLFEKNLESQFDRTLLIACSEKTQIERIQKRDALSASEAQKRLSHQLSMDAKTQRATDVLWNEGTIEDLYKNLENLDFIKNLS